MSRFDPLIFSDAQGQSFRSGFVGEFVGNAIPDQGSLAKDVALSSLAGGVAAEIRGLRGSNLDKVQVDQYCESMARSVRVEYEGACYHVMNRVLSTVRFPR